MTTRRGFLGGLAGVLAAGFAPAAIGSGLLMPVRKIALVTIGDPSRIFEPLPPSYTDITVSLANYSQLYAVSEEQEVLWGTSFIAGDNYRAFQQARTRRVRLLMDSLPVCGPQFELKRRLA
jgi:hypothetical protein